MNVRILTAAGSMLASFAMANVAIAQGGWPQLSIADIEPCRPQIVQFRQMEQAYFRSQISEYCTAGAEYYSAENCSTIQTWMNEKNQLNDMAWYYQGQSSCGGGDYPCFGVEVVNDPRTGDEEARWVDIFERNIAEMGTTIRPGTDFYDAGHVVDNCTTAIWLEKYRAWRNGAPAPTPPQVQLQPQPIGAPTPVASPSPASNAPAGNVDVWSRCISLTQYPRDGGIQTVWALNNTCTTTVIARFCYRAEYEAAGDPNLCSRREMRTQEIRPGASFDFPFTLIAPGTGLTDGRVVRSNELLVSGYACTGGNFPKAYFDGDGAFRSDGC